MDRRLLLRLFGVVGAAAALPAPALARMRDLAEVLGSETVDTRTLDALNELTHTYARQYGVVPPDDLSKLVSAHVDQAAARLDLPMPAAHRARLGSITSEAASLGGWLHCASGRRGEGMALLNGWRPGRVLPRAGRGRAGAGARRPRRQRRLQLAWRADVHR